MDKNNMELGDKQRLDALYQMISQAAQTCVGYPVNHVFDYSPLFRFLQYPINNLGDPYLPSIYRLNTHDFECEVLELFRQYTRAEPESFWGYVTNGGTEGNMYGIFLARELYPTGIVYYSQDTHYSVGKILRVLHARSIMLRSQSNGEIDYDDLRETLRIHRDVPPIILANIGTTMKGAVDNLSKIHEILDQLAITRHYIHCDAALSGMILPFVDSPQPFTFADGADSISISGHKMIGSPIPCGVALARRENVNRIARSVEYVGSLDTTLTGSRNAITPLFLWYALRTLGSNGFREMLQNCFDVAEYAIEKLNAQGFDAWRHKNSLTVVFRRPPEAVIRKWQLAPEGGVVHVITMPQVTKGHIDALMEDIKRASKRDTSAERQSQHEQHGQHGQHNGHEEQKEQSQLAPPPQLPSVTRSPSTPISPTHIDGGRYA